MMADPHYRARGMFEDVAFGGQPLKVPAILPRLTDTPGHTAWAGPAVGEHTAATLRDVLGLDDSAIAALVAAKAVAMPRDAPPPAAARS